MGFGSLINAGAQNALTSLQQGTNSLGAIMQNTSAQASAAALQNEAGNVFEQAQVEAQQAEIQGRQAYGQQAETFASSGVEIGGSPLAMLNQTRMETQQQVQLIQQQGALQQNLLEVQANQAQQTGLADVLTSQGQNQLTEQQNVLTQAQQKDQLEEQFWGGLLGFGGNALDQAMPQIVKSLMPQP
jgi:hypothetical protein